MKHFSYCSLKPALSYISVNLCQITPVRPVELLRIYTGVILSRAWPFVDIDMHSIYGTITLQAGMQARPLGKEKYKSQLQVISYPFPQSCCIPKSKLTGRTNQLELLGNNYSRPFQLQLYARQSEAFPPSVFFYSLCPSPALGLPWSGLWWQELGRSFYAGISRHLVISTHKWTTLSVDVYTGGIVLEMAPLII